MPKEALEEAVQLRFVSDPAALGEATLYIVTVPTPVTEARVPDFGPLEAASRTLAPYLRRGDLVVYESTVYPRATEEKCVPLWAAG